MVLDHGVFGLRPEGYHLTNLLLHVTNGLLVLAIVRVALPPLAFRRITVAPSTSVSRSTSIASRIGRMRFPSSVGAAPCLSRLT